VQFLQALLRGDLDLGPPFVPSTTMVENHWMRVLSAASTSAQLQEGQPRFCTVGKYPLTYVEIGTAMPAILLIHGSLNDLRSFERQMAPLSTRARTIALTLRHGYPERWDGHGDDFTIDQHSDDVAGVVAALELGAVHVLGHSRGGAVAIAMALRYPRLVRTLLLADPGGLEGLLPATPQGRAFAAQSEAMFARLRERLASGDETGAARGFIDELNGAGAWERRPELERQMVLENILTGPACARRPRFTPDELGSLEMPILALTGSSSPPRYSAMLEAMRAINPNLAPIVTIDGADHAMHRSRPEEFNAAVAAFLDANKGEEHCSDFAS
jgi:pimeloyl-ACP methyl ester carboxylesterase